MKLRVRLSMILCILFGILMLSGCGTSSDSDMMYSGQNLLNNLGEKTVENAIAFSCNSSYVPDTDGGSMLSYYNVAIVDNIMYIYEVIHTTTAENGRAIKYEISVSNSKVNKLSKFVEQENWSSLYQEVHKSIDGIDGTVVSEGMNDSSSRNDDGSYKWEVEFYDKFCLITLDEGVANYVIE